MIGSHRSLPRLDGDVPHWLAAAGRFLADGKLDHAQHVVEHLLKTPLPFVVHAALIRDLAAVWARRGFRPAGAQRVLRGLGVVARVRATLAGDGDVDAERVLAAAQRAEPAPGIVFHHAHVALGFAARARGIAPTTHLLKAITPPRLTVLDARVCPDLSLLGALVDDDVDLDVCVYVVRRLRTTQRAQLPAMLPVLAAIERRIDAKLC